MKIYVLLDETDPDYRDTACVSEDISVIYDHYLKNKETFNYELSLEIWNNGDCTDYLSFHFQEHVFDRIKKEMEEK